jgi:hypothetical protein
VLCLPPAFILSQDQTLSLFFFTLITLIVGAYIENVIALKDYLLVIENVTHNADQRCQRSSADSADSPFFFFHGRAFFFALAANKG